MGVSKKARRVEMGGIPKKAGCNWKSQEQEEKKLGSPSAVLGFLGLPIGRSRGPRKEISWKVTKDVMQLGQLGWSSGSKEFPGSCLMLLNV